MSFKNLTVKTKLLWAFSLVLALVGAQGALAYRSALRAKAANQKMIESSKVSAQILDTRNALIRAETGYNNYLFTASDKYIDAYRKAISEYPPKLDQLSQM